MIHWGIIGPGHIARVFCNGLRFTDKGQATAVASRDLQKARQFAADFSIATVHDSYQDLLADPSVDAVYIATIHPAHLQWVELAATAGKHILVEKPIGINAGEVAAMIKAAQCNDVFLMEAFMYRHHPQWIKAKQLVDEGTIGDLRTINSFFTYYNADPVNIRNMAEIGGGGLMDIGCYCISLARFIFNSEPQRVSGKIEYDPEFKTDGLCSGLLDFGDQSSTFSCATQLAPYQRVNIFVTKGRI